MVCDKEAEAAEGAMLSAFLADPDAPVAVTVSKVTLGGRSDSSSGFTSRNTNASHPHVPAHHYSSSSSQQRATTSSRHGDGQRQRHAPSYGSSREGSSTHHGYNGRSGSGRDYGHDGRESSFSSKHYPSRGPSRTSQPSSTHDAGQGRGGDNGRRDSYGQHNSSYPPPSRRAEQQPRGEYINTPDPRAIKNHYLDLDALKETQVALDFDILTDLPPPKKKKKKTSSSVREEFHVTNLTVEAGDDTAAVVPVTDEMTMAAE